MGNGMSSNEDYILRLENINKSFSSIKVLIDINLKLRKGSILGLCGENGAGKSTLMNVLGGVYKRDSGKIFLNNKEFNPESPRDAQKAGIAFIHQELNLFSNLTVVQNFMIENLPVKKPIRLIDEQSIRNSTKKALEEFGEDISITSLISDLDMGHRQLVEIAKETSKNARIIIFDEPTTSLSNKEKVTLFNIIRRLSKKGVSIIYISHILDDIFELCEDIVVLRDGRTVGTDKKENLSKHQVIRMMVNTEINDMYPRVTKTLGENVFSAKNIFRKDVLHDIALDLRRGEIVGLFGLMGAGRSELVRALFGVDKFESGTITVNGNDVKKISPITMKKLGVAYITEDRRNEGLLIDKTIKANIVLSILKKLQGRNRLIDKTKEDSKSSGMIKKLTIKTYDQNRQKAGQLSGGNQQKVVIAKWLLTESKILFLDEPTRGVDVGAKYEIYNYINQLASEGSSILFVSSEMEELMGVCDRILIMKKGKITGELKQNEYSQEKILEMAIEW
ncbi:MAG: sugar ABC transporter ATP-binding protein [Spirochaetes bacterium]|nr:sugar ABC transporter ATP-binding protein [Spirochaetota bacterium]